LWSGIKGVTCGRNFIKGGKSFRSAENGSEAVEYPANVD
jgi:hypothetical protein